MEPFKELLLFGFIRRFYKFLIPHDVIKELDKWAILLDQWDEEYTDFHIEISQNNHRIIRYHKISSWKRYSCHAIGTYIVQPGDTVYWDLKLNSSLQGIKMKIGIIDCQEAQLGIHDFTEFNQFGYGLSTIDSVIYHKGKEFAYHSHYNWTEGCVIRVELNMSDIKKGTLCYFIRKNGKENKDKVDDLECIAYFDIDSRNYKLCVSLLGDLNQVELIHVSQVDKVV